MSNHDIGRVWAATDAAEATERALRGALTEWNRTVTADHYVFTLVEDGTWTIRLSVRSPLVAVFEPLSLPGDPMARLNDVSPSNVAAVLLALGVPEVGVEVLVP